LKISYILFDAANTLIWKPNLFSKYWATLEKNGYFVDMQDLKRCHKMLSEVLKFPDRTSEQFYASFNSEVLLSLGIIPSEKLLKEIFEACTYLSWDKYPDTSYLSGLDVPLGILSNFNSSLSTHITNLFGDRFRDIIISENMGVAKPSLDFYIGAIKTIGLPADEILYIGDSMKLDVIPAMESGMQAWLVDREGWFKGFDKRISSFSEISLICNK
jgi:putative hydrolase of the HAD superfamily